MCAEDATRRHVVTEANAGQEQRDHNRRELAVLAPLVCRHAIAVVIEGVGVLYMLVRVLEYFFGAGVGLVYMLVLEYSIWN